MEPVQPTSIGKYEILSVIGRGGMGVVYRAQDPLMGRQVAIKTVTEGLSKDTGMLQRFYGEAEKMGMLRHPNIITVYDLGEQDGFPYIVMEFVEGDPLDRVIQSESSLPLYHKLHIIEQVCGALAYAHQNSVVHRDVKPGNVIVRPDGVAKLLDFGIARQVNNELDRTQTIHGGVIGTVSYMAPERLKGDPFDGRSDIFSVGVLLFQLLTGKLPFTGTEFALINQLLNEKHPPLSDFLQHYPSALDSILDRSVAKDPVDRYQSADEMAADLYSVIEALKQDYSAELIGLAQRLASEEDYVGAQNALFRLLKVDSKNIQARVMTKELGLRVTQKARADLAGVKQREAQEALRDNNFDTAILLLEEAAGLVPDDPSVPSQLETARSKKQTHEQIRGYLQQAEAARSHGDYHGAQAIVEKAIQLDTGNSRLRAAYQSLVRQAEEAGKQARLRELLATARKAINQSEFEGALDLLGQARLIEPENLEIQVIERAAKDEILQQHRRKLLLEIEDQISAAVTGQDAERVRQVISQALEKSPTDAVLLRHQAHIDRVVREYQIKALVDETLRECGAAVEKAPLEALEKVRTVLLEVPGDSQLLLLESRIQQRIEQMSTEEARTAILLQAREVLKERRYAKAVDILEQCNPPVLTTEISELLNYARQESLHQQQQELIARTYAEAQTLVREEKHEDLISLLAPIVKSNAEPRLQAMLDNARRVVEQRNAEITAVLSRLQPLVDAACHEQIVALIQSLPGTVPKATEIQTLLRASQIAWKQEWAGLEKLGRRYAALQSGDMETIEWDLSAEDRPNWMQSMSDMLLGHRTTVVDRILMNQVKHIQETKAAGGPAYPARRVADNRKLLPFASDTVRTEWSSIANMSGSHKMEKFFSLIGKRRN